MTGYPPLTWSLVIPVKVLARAKSRLSGLAGPRRPELALALAADTVAAATRCREVAAVIVVSDDPAAAARLAGLGALVIPDDPDDGLNPALRHGAVTAAGLRPDSGTGALAADLPALRPAELGRALRAAANWAEAFVPDAAGSGTTLYTAAPGSRFQPRFGPGSRLAHLGAGAAELGISGIDSLRRDVDTPGDLGSAARLGLGPHTAPIAADLFRGTARPARELEADDGAGEGAGDSVDGLDLGDDEPAEVVDVLGLGAHDDVIWAGHVLRLGHAGDLGDPRRDLGGLADLGLDEDICVDHDVLPGRPRSARKRYQEWTRYRTPGRRARSLEAAITIGELGEFDLIAAVAARMPQPSGALVGIGDDAAVLRVPDSRVTASTDLLVEGVHFRRDWSRPGDVGVKASAQNLADVAAMGAVPEALLVGLAAPADLPVSWALDLASGLAEEAARAGAYVTGGDMARAGLIVISVTAIGTMAGRDPVTRGGARPSDVLAVTGRLGEAAAGLALLQAGLDEPARAVAAHRRPRPPYPAGPAAAGLGATSMIDISDGLLADLGHIADASGVRIDVETGRLPVAPPLTEAARALGLDPDAPAGAPGPLSWMLTGGEDHALAATFPAGTEISGHWVVIGHVRHGHGVLVDGTNYPGAAGWRHFADQ